MAGTLIIMRHGQSQWNRENRFTGWADVPLSEQGEAETRAAAEKLRAYQFDRAFSSALIRTRESLRIVLETTGQAAIPVVATDTLNGRHYGDLEGRNKAEVIREFGAEQVHIWRRSYDVPPPGGESLQEAQVRVLAYYCTHIEPCVLGGETVLVVSHGNTLRALIMALEHISPEDIKQINIPTAAPRRYVIDDAGDGTGKVLEFGYL